MLEKLKKKGNFKKIKQSKFNRKEFRKSFEAHYPYVFKKKLPEIPKEKTNLATKLGRSFPLIATSIMLGITLPIIVALFIRFTIENLIVLIFSLILFLISLTPTIKWFYYKIRANHYLKETLKNSVSRVYIQLRDGNPGAGKSSGGGFDSFELAKILWEELKFKVFLLKVNYKKILKSGSQAQIADMAYVFESYNFWAKHPEAIPCLLSNIPFKVGNRYCAIVSFDYISQLKKLPYNSVVFYDELAADCEAVLKKEQKKYDGSSQLFKFDRHFTEDRIIATEQDRNSPNINFRRCCGLNRRMQSQEWVGYSKLVNSYYEKLKSKIIKKYIENQKPIRSIFKIKFALFLAEFLKHNGFRKYNYVDSKTIGYDNEKIVKEKTFSYIVPTDLNGLEYDDRTFKEAYRAKDLKLDIEIYNDLILSKNEITRRFKIKDEINKQK